MTRLTLAIPSKGRLKDQAALWTLLPGPELTSKR